MEEQRGPASVYVVGDTEEAFTDGDEAQAYAVIQRIHNKMSGGTGRPPAVSRVRVDAVDLPRAAEAVIDYATEKDLEWFAQAFDLSEVQADEQYDDDEDYESDVIDNGEEDSAEEDMDDIEESILRERGEGLPDTVDEDIYTVDLPIDADEFEELLNDAESIAIERWPGDQLEGVYLARKADGRFAIVARHRIR